MAVHTHTHKHDKLDVLFVQHLYGMVPSHTTIGSTTSYQDDFGLIGPRGGGWCGRSHGTHGFFGAECGQAQWGLGDDDP